MMAINICSNSIPPVFINFKKKKFIKKMGNCLGLDGDGNGGGGGGGPTAEERRRLQLAAADRRT